MKKIFFIILFSDFIGLPILAAAITPGTIPGAGELGVQPSPVNTTQDLVNRVASVVGWVYTVFFIIAVLFILFAAFNYLTAGGNSEKVKDAHTQLIYAAIAIAIALLAVGATTIIKDFLGSGGSTNTNTNTTQIPVTPGYTLPPAQSF